LFVDIHFNSDYQWVNKAESNQRLTACAGIPGQSDLCGSVILTGRT
jgi:hypothetical protein